MRPTPCPHRYPITLTAIAAAALPLPALAQVTRYYVGNGANWDNPSSWSDATVPASGDTASLSTSSNLTVPFDGDYPAPAALAAVVLDGTGDATLTLSQTTPFASLRAGNQYIGYAGHAAYDQSAGSNTATTTLYLGYAAGSAGAYSLSGGALNVPGTEYVGESGSGTFAQSGGTHSVLSTLYVGHLPSATGTFTLSAGSLHLGDGLSDSNGLITVGGQGTGMFDQSGGTLTAFRSLLLGGAAGATGSYTLSGNAVLSIGGARIANSETVGYGGTGSFTQTGGTHTISGTLFLVRSAGGTGTYSLSAGSLAAGKTTIYSHGTFSYTGGSASLGAITLAGTGQLLLSPGHDKTLLATSLTLATTARLDLSDDTLTLSATPAGTIRSDLAAQSLTSSSADSTHRLGYLDTGTSLLVRLTLAGDANLDGKLDADDYALLDKGLATHGVYWWQGDFNYDGQVNSADYLLIDTTYGQAQGFSPGFLAMRESQFGDAYVSQLLTSVPEPSSLACFFAGCFLTRRRSRR